MTKRTPNKSVLRNVRIFTETSETQDGRIRALDPPAAERSQCVAEREGMNGEL